jgi:hypothetical protein
MIPANGVKNNTSDARYPISQRTVPRPAVSLIHCFIQVVFTASHSCALRWPTVSQCTAKKQGEPVTEAEQEANMHERLHLHARSMVKLTQQS